MGDDIPAGYCNIQWSLALEIPELDYFQRSRMGLAICTIARGQSVSVVIFCLCTVVMRVIPFDKCRRTIPEDLLLEQGELRPP
jgi:hypothetical protein